MKIYSIDNRQQGLYHRWHNPVLLTDGLMDPSSSLALSEGLGLLYTAWSGCTVNYCWMLKGKEIAEAYAGFWGVSFFSLCGALERLCVMVECIVSSPQNTKILILRWSHTTRCNWLKFQAKSHVRLVFAVLYENWFSMDLDVSPPWCPHFQYLSFVTGPPTMNYGISQ